MNLPASPSPLFQCMRKDHAISRAIPAHRDSLPDSFWRVKKVSETRRVTEQVADYLKPLRGQEQEQERAGLAAPRLHPQTQTSPACSTRPSHSSVSVLAGLLALRWSMHCPRWQALLCQSFLRALQPPPPRSGEPPRGDKPAPTAPLPCRAPPACGRPRTFCRDPNAWICREGRACSGFVWLFAFQGKGNVKQVSHQISVLAPKERKRYYSPDYIIMTLTNF